MDQRPAVTLQINLAPTDLPHAQHILPHQLRQLGRQVEEILLVVDLHRSRGRYAEAWEERLPGLRALIERCCAEYPHARSVDVDYSDDVAARISRAYFGGGRMPAKDWNGAPFYAYFFGLDNAQHDHIFHMDSDLLYGGGSQTWVDEAVRLLAERPDVLICSPLPGPPRADGRLVSREDHASLAYRADGLSTRLFLLDRRRFERRIGELELTQPSARHRWQARADGNPPYDTAEEVWSKAMVKHDLRRVDFLGAAPGLWSLHPPHRSPLFYNRLPALIAQVQAGDVPDAQRGDHDMNDSMISWSSARQPLWRRVAKHQRLLLTNVAGRLRSA
jgi:hypothetical protein